MTNRALHLKYGHDPLELSIWSQAYERYPVLKKDCPTTRAFKDAARNDYVKKLRRQREEINTQID